eukprot:11089601-Ditylum_brightwellii.AAC.1
MDLLLHKQDGLASSAVDSIKQELDKRNIGDGYNTTRLMSIFKEHNYCVVARINRLEGGTKGRKHSLVKDTICLTHGRCAVGEGSFRAYPKTG